MLFFFEVVANILRPAFFIAFFFPAFFLDSFLFLFFHFQFRFYFLFFMFSVIYSTKTFAGTYVLIHEFSFIFHFSREKKNWLPMLSQYGSR